MKRTRPKLKLHKATIRILDDLKPVAGGFITTKSVSGNGCATSCWCVSEFVSDCGPC